MRPKTIVKSGVSELRMPASELSITVCALAKRKAGMPVPIKAIIEMYFNLPLGTFRIWIRAKGSKTIKDTKILIEPTTALE
jgi:hypothetical protein